MPSLARALLLCLGLSAFAFTPACASGGDTSDYIGDDGGPSPVADAGAGDVTAPSDVHVADTAAVVEASSKPEASAGDGATTPGDGGEDDVGVPESGSDGSSSTCAAHGFSGALLTFDLTSQSGSETSAPSTASAAGVGSSTVSRASGLKAAAGSGSINASGWPTASSADPTLYYAFTVTPAAGCTLALTSLALDVKASSTGPAHASVGTSVDGYAALSTPVAGTSSGSVSLSASAAAPITVHVFGYGGSGTAGTFRIQNTLTLSGTLN